ncbi:MAG: type II secretion system protein [Deltaproteobacteria bacterium]|nr:type II secretion system protein [Deltaproteobacteria bacterium]
MAKEKIKILKTGILNRSSGFTLIELAIVIMILGIILSIAAPKLPKPEILRIKSEIRELKALITLLYDEALIKKNFYRLNYDISNGRYWVTILQKNKEYVKDTNILKREKELPSNLKFEDIITTHAGKKMEGITFSQFFPSGFVEETFIHLKSSKGKYLTLHILPLTGEVKSYEGYKEERAENIY